MFHINVLYELIKTVDYVIIIIVYMVRKIHGKPKTDGVRFLRFSMEN